VVKLVRSGTKQPQPYSASAADKARLFLSVLFLKLLHSFAVLQKWFDAKYFLQILLK